MLTQRLHQPDNAKEEADEGEGRPESGDEDAARDRLHHAVEMLAVL